MNAPLTTLFVIFNLFDKQNKNIHSLLLQKMNVSTLSNTQQKRGVATKKKASLKGLRNVFAQPFNNYW